MYNACMCINPCYIYLSTLSGLDDAYRLRKICKSNAMIENLKPVSKIIEVIN